MCKMKMEITGARRNLRWVLDHTNSPDVFKDCYDMISQTYEMLRGMELECLSQQNNPKNSCLLSKGR